MARKYRAALFLVALGAAALGAAGACSSFDSAAGPATTDGGPGADAPADDAPRSDAPPPFDAAVGVDAATLTGCALRYASGDAGIEGGALLFCDDFEGRTDVKGRWTGTGETNGSVTLSKQLVRAGAQSLHASVDGGFGRAYLTVEALDAGFPLVVEFGVYVQQLPPPVPNMPYNGFVLVSVTNPGFHLLYVGVSGQDQFNPYLLGTDQVLNLSMGRWFHMAYRLNATESGLIISEVGAAPLAERPGERGPVPGAPPEPTLQIGIETGGGPVELFIDDVFVHR